MKYLNQNRYGLCALAIIIFALLLRILLVSLGWPPSNSDEGTMGIMALHIAYHGEHPVLYYGQNYMGAIEASLGAFFFHLLEHPCLPCDSALCFCFPFSLPVHI